MKLLHTGVVGNELALAFEGGREIYLSLSLLRNHCPCAACSDLHGIGSVVVSPKADGMRETTLMDIQVVGSYAIQLHWQDGHSAGIYSYDYLCRLAENPA